MHAINILHITCTVNKIFWNSISASLILIRTYCRSVNKITTLFTRLFVTLMFYAKVLQKQCCFQFKMVKTQKLKTLRKR